MKIYQLRMSYSDGDHDHGYWESPYFATREACEQFKKALLALPDGDSRKWGTHTWSFYSDTDPIDEYSCITEIEIQEAFSGELPPRESMLVITHT